MSASISKPTTAVRSHVFGVDLSKTCPYCGNKVCAHIARTSDGRLEAAALEAVEKKNGWRA